MADFDAAAFQEEVQRRAMALLTLRAATQGARFSKRDRDTLKVGIAVGATVALDVMNEHVKALNDGG